MTLHVLYNGACPICAPEIEHYRRLATRSGADIRFEDLNTTDLGAWGIDADTARRRLHARLDTRQLAGVEAFAALWARLPGWHWMARIVSLPGIAWLAAVAYERIAAPWLYARSRARACPLPQPGASPDA